MYYYLLIIIYYYLLLLLLLLLLFIVFFSRIGSLFSFFDEKNWFYIKAIDLS